MNPSLAFLGDVGGLELLVIALLALVMFGSKRLPELGRAAGRAIREFKKATSGVEENLREVLREDPMRDILRPAPKQVARGRSAHTPPPSSASPAELPPPATGPTPSAGASPESPPPRSSPPPPSARGSEDDIAG